MSNAFTADRERTVYMGDATHRKPTATKQGDNEMNEEKTIDCQGEGCGRQAHQEDEDYYTCGRCGWAGSSDNPVVVLRRQVTELESELRDCHDLLNDCGYYFVNGAWTDPQDDHSEVKQ